MNHPSTTFRLGNLVQEIDRLKGTQVYLDLTNGTRIICGTITSVNPNGNSVDDQTYSVACPSGHTSKSVFLYDDVVEKNDDMQGSTVVMNIAEVLVYSVRVGPGNNIHR